MWNESTSSYLRIPPLKAVQLEQMMSPITSNSRNREVAEGSGFYFSAVPFFRIRLASSADMMLAIVFETIWSLEPQCDVKLYLWWVLSSDTISTIAIYLIEKMSLFAALNLPFKLDRRWGFLIDLHECMSRQILDARSLLRLTAERSAWSLESLQNCRAFSPLAFGSWVSDNMISSVVFLRFPRRAPIKCYTECRHPRCYVLYPSTYGRRLSTPTVGTWW